MLAAITSTIGDSLKEELEDDNIDEPGQMGSTSMDDLAFGPWEHDPQPTVANPSHGTMPKYASNHPGNQLPRWIEKFPGQAGTKIRCGVTVYKQLKNDQEEKGVPKWGPFRSEDDWELAKWIMASGSTQKSTDLLLDLPIVS